MGTINEELAPLFPSVLHGTVLENVYPEVIIPNRNICFSRLMVMFLVSFNLFHSKRIMTPDRHDGIKELTGDIWWIIEHWGVLNAMLSREREAKERDAATEREYIEDRSGSTVLDL